jgi:hypothetical protein
MMVMSEPLRTDQGTDEIAEHTECYDGGKDIIAAHLQALAHQRVADRYGEEGQTGHHEYDIQHDASNESQTADNEAAILEAARLSILRRIKQAGIRRREYGKRGL